MLARPGGHAGIPSCAPETSCCGDTVRKSEPALLAKGKINEEHDWEMMYCFTELGFLPGDYRVMNLSTSISPTTFFTKIVFMEKKLLSEDGEIIGNIILATGAKRGIHGKKEREIKFESEEDRVKAVEEHFGVKLGIVERDSILGLMSQIKSER
ncbi:hypothetical protein SLS60_008145 [Paraconiothyrium brasiliense]|uniref:Arylamine N-acetyltransferase n=1 Tax=Paraconiothyrium brasiliense TaxID=300254 RepID=A0ABR3R3H4_9PLEO